MDGAVSRASRASCGFSLALLAVLTAVPVAGATAAIISSGNIRLGVQDFGMLMAPTSDVARNCATSTTADTASGSVSVHGWMGLWYLPTRDEGMDCDWEGEGWGVAYNDGSWKVGYANTGTSATGLQFLKVGTLVSFAADAQTATSVVDVGALRITQKYEPFHGNPDTYTDHITLANMGPLTMRQVSFRRLMNWGSGEESDDWTFMSMGRLAGSPPSPALVSSYNTDWANRGSPNPQVAEVVLKLGPPGGSFVDYYEDQSVHWNLNFGDLPAGQSKTFTMDYGAAANADQAMADLQEIGAQAYAIAKTDQSPCRMISAGGAYRQTGGCYDGLPRGATPLAKTPQQFSGGDGHPVTWFQAFSGLSLWSPTAAFSLRSPEPCTDYDVQFLDQSQGATAWQWEFGDGSTSHSQNPLHRFPAQATSYRVSLTVRSSDAPSAPSSTVTHDVVSPDHDCPPELDPIPDHVIRLGEALPRLCFHAHDVDDPDPHLAWTVSFLPRGANVDRSHCMSWTPQAGQLGTWPVSAQVCDRHACDQKDFHIIVWTPPPAGPVAGCSDYDRDGVCDPADNCPGIPNYSQADANHDGIGDSCQSMERPADVAWVHLGFADLPDRDHDGVADPADNCPQVPNRNQSDMDADGVGDACDSDLDGDGIVNGADNCPWLANPSQGDADGDGLGDACQRFRVQPGPLASMVEVARPVAFPSSPLRGLSGNVAFLWLGATLLTGLLALALSKRWLIAILFSRLAGTDLLLHPHRAAMMARIEADPGVHKEALIHALAIGRGAATHHLRVLERAGLLHEVRQAASTRYFPGRKAENKEASQSTVAPPLAEQILEAVRGAPLQSLSQIARTLGQPQQTVHYQARRLAQEGRLHLERRGREVQARLPSMDP